MLKIKHYITSEESLIVSIRFTNNVLITYTIGSSILIYNKGDVTRTYSHIPKKYQPFVDEVTELVLDEMYQTRVEMLSQDGMFNYNDMGLMEKMLRPIIKRFDIDNISIYKNLRTNGTTETQLTRWGDKLKCYNRINLRAIQDFQYMLSCIIHEIVHAHYQIKLKWEDKINSLGDMNFIWDLTNNSSEIEAQSISNEVQRNLGLEPYRIDYMYVEKYKRRMDENNHHNLLLEDYKMTQEEIEMAIEELTNFFKGLNIDYVGMAKVYKNSIL